MKTLGKFLGLLLLIVLLLAVALGFALTHLLDPNDYKDDIRKLARDKGGVDLVLNGPIGWSLFPWVGLQLNDVQVATPQNEQKPFARLDQLGLAVQVMPLFSSELRMSAVRLDGLKLDLKRDAKGKGNWEMTTSQQPATGQPKGDAPADTARTPQQPAPADKQEMPPLQLAIESVEITNASVNFTDEASGTFQSISELNITTGAIREGSPIPLQVSGNFSSSPPKMSGNTQLTAIVRFDTKIQRYELQDLKLSGKVSGDIFSGKTLEYGLEGQLLADMAAGNAEWRNMKLRANELTLLNEIRIRQLDKPTPLIEAQLSAAPFNLRTLLAGLGMNVPQTSDPKALTSISFSSDLTTSGQNMALDNLKLQLDDTLFSGSVKSHNLAAGQVAVELRGTSIDVDRYLPPQQQSAATQDKPAERGKAPAQAQTGWSKDPLLPLPVLRSLDNDLSLNMDSLTVSKLPLQKVSLRMQASGGQLQLKQLFSQLFGGTIDLKGALDARSDTPKLNLQVQQSNLPVEKILAALDPATPPQVRGNMQMNARINAQGNSQFALVNSLGGNAGFQLDNGAIVGLGIEQKMCQGIALINRQPLTQSFPADTPVQALKASLQISKGVARNDDLSVQASGLDVAGKGQINLPKMSIDYRTGITVTDAYRARDEACRINERLAKIAWPLRCQGPLADIGSGCGLDKDEMQKIVAKAAGAKVEEKLQEKLQEKLGDKAAPLGDALKGLFGR